jgi:hypothetical protein
VGDTVVARYFRALGVQLKPEGAPDAPVVDLAGGRAAEGERPAATVGTRLTIPVTIVSVRTDGNVVSFYGEDGLARDESIAYAIAPSTRPSLAALAGCFQQPASAARPAVATARWRGRR